MGNITWQDAALVAILVMVVLLVTHVLTVHVG